MSQLRIGQNYQGGVIAYILLPGDTGYDSTIQKGLIAAPADQSITAGAFWAGLPYIFTGASGVIIGTGAANTDSMIAHQNSGTNAASLCRSLTLGGYNDWYLPSKNELQQLFLNKNLIGGFDTTTFYWSSSEYNRTYAWDEAISDGVANFDYKNSNSSVRAIRSF